MYHALARCPSLLHVFVSARLHCFWLDLCTCGDRAVFGPRKPAMAHLTRAELNFITMRRLFCGNESALRASVHLRVQAHRRQHPMCGPRVGVPFRRVAPPIHWESVEGSPPRVEDHHPRAGGSFGWSLGGPRCVPCGTSPGAFSCCEHLGLPRGVVRLSGGSSCPPGYCCDRLACVRATVPRAGYGAAGDA